MGREGILYFAVGGAICLPLRYLVFGSPVSDIIGRFELAVFAGPENGNVCKISQEMGGNFVAFRLDCEDLYDLQYVVEKALRALEPHE